MENIPQPKEEDTHEAMGAQRAHRTRWEEGEWPFQRKGKFRILWLFLSGWHWIM